MVLPTKDSQKKVKLEDLLRIKRSERPSDAFWGNFDRELHQRMLQTLVKKDPVHIQIFRGLSGRFAQSTAVACAAAFLALMVVRPAFVGTTPAASTFAEAELDYSNIAEAVPVEVAMSDLDVATAESDYSIEGISAETISQDATFIRDFEMDGFQLALDADYSSDETFARPSFGSTGVASLVY